MQQERPAAEAGAGRTCTRAPAGPPRCTRGSSAARRPPGYPAGPARCAARACPAAPPAPSTPHRPTSAAPWLRRCCAAPSVWRPPTGASECEHRACSAPYAQAQGAVSSLHGGSSAAAPGHAARAPELHLQHRRPSLQAPQLSPSRTASRGHPAPPCCFRWPAAAPLPSRAPQVAGAPATVHQVLVRSAKGHSLCTKQQLVHNATGRYRSMDGLYRSAWCFVLTCAHLWRAVLAAACRLFHARVVCLRR